MDLEKFFRDEGIDVYAAVRTADLPEADRADALQLVPDAFAIIVFGKEIPAEIYTLPQKERTRHMIRIAESLDRTARTLANCLNAENFRSEPVPLFLPLRIVEDRVQGIIRLKQIAAWGGLGTIGKNTLLISPRYGTRLALSGVVTKKDTGTYGTPLTADLCRTCGRCVQECPEGAIGFEGVNMFRCKNIRHVIPPPLVPAVLWLLRRRQLQQILAPLASWIARHATISCNRALPHVLGSTAQDFWTSMMLLKGQISDN
ncbi:MAG: Epoxyqueuosine reductase [Methanoregula sp. PtaU1.Bin051]|nr:MAG: Epoxyqueuosine reductase [Methanoregula sp. PtaU1.Bin051]